MAEPALPVRGGPYDGESWGSAEPFVAYADAIYRRTGEAFEFLGHRAWRCEGCGGIVTPSRDDEVERGRCPLCGHRTPRGYTADSPER